MRNIASYEDILYSINVFPTFISLYVPPIARNVKSIPIFHSFLNEGFS